MTSHYIFDRTWLKPAIVKAMKRRAAQGVYDDIGRSQYYLNRCRGFHPTTGTLLTLTRDTGHHSSGWWKNPDYERCWHLSLSFRDPSNLSQPIPKDAALSREWIELVFADNRRKLWCEPPYSPEGKILDVWHYRLFCAPNWTPIIPRGEVYNRELTEAGWLSWSDARAADQAEAERRKATT